MNAYLRRFKAWRDLDRHACCAEEAGDEAESDTINVFRPDDEYCLDTVKDTGGRSFWTRGQRCR
jgi:hypothetical protein